MRLQGGRLSSTSILCIYLPKCECSKMTIVNYMNKYGYKFLGRLSFAIEKHIYRHIFIISNANMYAWVMPRDGYSTIYVHAVNINVNWMHSSCIIKFIARVSTHIGRVKLCNWCYLILSKDNSLPFFQQPMKFPLVSKNKKKANTTPTFSVELIVTAVKIWATNRYKF